MTDHRKRQHTFLIISWDISETKVSGPYDTAGDAHAALADNPNAFLENVMVIGPMPVSTRGGKLAQLRSATT